jgi:hypothetical protein
MLFYPFGDMRCVVKGEQMTCVEHTPEELCIASAREAEAFIKPGGPPRRKKARIKQNIGGTVKTCPFAQRDRPRFGEV